MTRAGWLILIGILLVLLFVVGANMGFLVGEHLDEVEVAAEGEI
ncbi:hypothetical protein [Pontixanthobacter luteolus]|nr:hypothetical protein [Pontixanthobacter luteolus]